MMMMGSRQFFFFLAVVLLGLVVVPICNVSARSTSDLKNEDYDPDLIEDDEDIQNDEYDYGDFHEDNGAASAVQPSEDANPLVIKTQPQTLIVRENSTVRLPCEIEDTRWVPVFLWSKNNQAVYQEHNRFDTFGPNFKLNYTNTSRTLIIEGVTANETASYTCSFLLSERKFLNVTHQLFVEAAPRIVAVKSQHGDAVIDEGKTMVLTCSAEGYPRPNITWSHKGNRMLANGETLTIENVSHKDSGAYQCLADNGINQPAHGVIHIKVTQKPVVRIEKFTVTSNKNLDTELICQVQGTPKPAVNWIKDGHNVPMGQRHRFSNDKDQHVLHIMNVQVTDFGVYTCFAKNRIGSSASNVTLTGYPTPATIQKAKRDHDKCQLVWEVESKTPIEKYILEYKKVADSEWTSISPKVTNADGNTYTVDYTLTDLIQGVHYEARLRSQNTYGWSEHSQTVKCEGVHKHHHKAGPEHVTRKADNNAGHQRKDQHENEVYIDAETPAVVPHSLQNEAASGGDISQDSQRQEDQEKPRQGAKSLGDSGHNSAPFVTTDVLLLITGLCLTRTLWSLH